MMRLRRAAILFGVLAGWQAFGQVPTWDTSGNNLLSGTYYFRDVAWQFTSSGSSQSAVFGTITFNGAGTYSVSGTLLGNTGTYTFNGTYSINAAGFGFLTDPFATGAVIRATVSSGVLIGSATEGGYNSLFIGAQLPSPTPSLSTFSGTFSMAYMNFPSPVNGYPYDAQFTLSPNGSGTVTTSNVAAYYGTATGTGQVTQNVPSSKYTANNGAIVITFPNFNAQTTTVLSTQEYLYFSPDGNFVFGGSPQQTDMLVGIRNGAGGSPLMSSALYNAAGVYSVVDSAGFHDFDSYYGSFALKNGVIIAHQRTFSPAEGLGSDSVAATSAPTTAGATYSDFANNYTIGDGGSVRIGIGLPPYLGISVAIAAPDTSQGSGVYLNPAGVSNAASYAPFTTGVSPGEMIVLTGTNLANGALQIETSATSFPTNIGGVQVLIDSIPAPLYYVSSTQIAAVVPYAVSQFAYATIQVNNNGTLSNKISQFVSPGVPGVFTHPIANGISDAAAVLYDANGNSLGIVSTSNPALAGDTVAVFVTGLGAVFPPISDGTVASTTTLSPTVNTITAYIYDSATGVAKQATVTFAGLAPGAVGLYQVNLTIPAGLTPGESVLEIDELNSAGKQISYQQEAVLPIGSSTGVNVPSPAGAEVQNGQAYKPAQHRKTRPAQKNIVVNPVQP